MSSFAYYLRAQYSVRLSPRSGRLLDIEIFGVVGSLGLPAVIPVIVFLVFLRLNAL